MKMTPANTSSANAQTAIRRAARQGSVVLTRHARERMEQRGIGPDEVEDALMRGAVIADRTEPENWLVIGDGPSQWPSTVSRGPSC